MSFFDEPLMTPEQHAAIWRVFLKDLKVKPMSSLRGKIRDILNNPKAQALTQEVDDLEELVKEYASAEVAHAVRSLRDDPLRASVCVPSTPDGPRSLRQEIEAIVNEDRARLPLSVFEIDALVELVREWSPILEAVRRTSQAPVLVAPGHCGCDDCDNIRAKDHARNAGHAEIDRLNLLCGELYSQIAGLEKSKLALKEKLLGVNHTLSESNLRLLKRNRELIERIDKHMDTRKTDARQRCALKDENRGLAKELAEVREFNGQTLLDKADLATNLNGLLDHERTENTRLHADLKTLKEEYAQYRRRTGKIHDENARLIEANQNLARHIAVLEEDQRRYKSTNLREENKRLTRDCERTTVRNALDENTKIRRDLTEKAQEIEGLKIRVERLKEQQRWRRKVHGKRLHIKELEKKLGRIREVEEDGVECPCGRRVWLKPEPISTREAVATARRAAKITMDEAPTAERTVEQAERELKKASEWRDTAYENLRKAMGLPSAEEIRAEMAEEEAAWKSESKDANPVKPEYFDILFDGAGPDKHFIEVEDDEGYSMNLGTWIERPDGLWALRFYPEDLKPGNRPNKALKPWPRKPEGPPCEEVRKGGGSRFTEIPKRGFWVRLFTGKDRS